MKNILIIFLLLLTANAQAVTVAPGTLGLFRFNGNMNNETGANDGTEVGTINYPANPGPYENGGWVQSSSPGDSNYIYYDKDLLKVVAGAVEMIVDPTGAVGIGQNLIGVAPERDFEINAFVGLDILTVLTDGVGSAVNFGGLDLTTPFYVCVTWNGTVTDVYFARYTTGTATVGTISDEGQIADSPLFTNMNVNTDIWSFKSFNNLDDFEGLLTMVRFSNVYKAIGDLPTVDPEGLAVKKVTDWIKPLIIIPSAYLQVQ